MFKMKILKYRSYLFLNNNASLPISGADSSFAAPLSFDVSLNEGTVTVSDMFDLYRYENLLYTIEMSGEEIDRYLEYSYSQWFNTLSDPDGNLFETEIYEGIYRFKNRTYNFDSAAGMDYIVDVSKPDGDKIFIESFPDGRVFEHDRSYSVALSSCRGSGGGDHLSHASSLQNEDLQSRLLKSTDKDLRYYMIRWFEENENIIIETDNNWYLIPEHWVSVAGNREYKALFDNCNNR